MNRVICPSCMNLFHVQTSLEDATEWQCNICRQQFTKEEWLRISYQEYLDSIYNAFKQ